MTSFLLEYLCDPSTKEALTLIDAAFDSAGNIINGGLRNSAGKVYPIINGIPRFNDDFDMSKTVTSFGDEWNHFNFNDFKNHWLEHAVKNTFGSVATFDGKVIVDAGGGSGMQTLWMLESGAKHVILIDLSHSVDDVVRRNLEKSGYKNYDVIQGSIDCPPLKANSIDGMVICHNVIQHTPSVEKTARALFEIVRPGAEFVFNCYPKEISGMARKLRWGWYRLLRNLLPRLPFSLRLFYARLMGILRFVPFLGWVLEKSHTCTRGDVPRGGEDALTYIKHLYKATVLNTFDAYGAHRYQHHKTDAELKKLLGELQPDRNKIMNYDRYFSAPPRPVGIALRVFK